MTSDPFQILMTILLMAVIPFFVWIQGRVAELMEEREEKRVPESLKFLVRKEYIEAVCKGEREPEKSYRWKIPVVVVGLVLPLIILCSAKAESLIPSLMVVLASAALFFIGVALLEWLLRPRKM